MVGAEVTVSQAQKSPSGNRVGFSPLTADYLANRIARQIHVPGNLPNRFVIWMVGKANFTNSFHDQHLLKEAPLSGRTELEASAEVGQLKRSDSPIDAEPKHLRPIILF